MNQLTIVIPTLDEAGSIGATLEALTRLPSLAEIIVVDGGSRDETTEIARSHGARVIIAEQTGRGAQMHAGARIAVGDVLWFLHADTIPPAVADEKILDTLRDPHIVGGNCRIRFDGDTRAAGFLTWLYPQLRRIGLIYGDSGIYVRREAYEACGGFQAFPIFEDLDFVRRLRRHGKLARADVTLVTSSRRFERRSFALTFARWSIMQVLFWIGVSPLRLARSYAPIRTQQAIQTIAEDKPLPKSDA